MKMNWKRGLSLFLSFIMIVGMVPASVFTAFAAAQNPQWDTSVITSPYVIKVGPGEASQITQQQLYALLDEKWDTNLLAYKGTGFGGFKYGNTELKNTDGTDSAGLVNGTEYEVYTAVITYGTIPYIGTQYPNGQTWTSTGAKFKVVEVAAKDTITVTNTGVSVGYNPVKTMAEQLSTFRSELIGALGAITVNDSTTYDAAKLSVQFHYFKDNLISDDDDYYLELNATNVSKFDSSEATEKWTFRVSYGTSEAINVVVTTFDNRQDIPTTYVATAASKDGTSGIQSAAATVAAELGLAAAAFTVPSDWQEQMSSLNAGETKSFAVTATYGGGTVYKGGTVTVNVTVTKSAVLPATVTVVEQNSEGNTLDGGDVVITNKDNATIGATVGTGENPLTVTVTPNKGNGWAYYVTNIVVTDNKTRATVATATGTNTLTFYVENSELEALAYTVTVTYGQKKLEVNSSSEANPVEIPYNFGLSISEQQDAVKEAIFNALVNSGASGLTDYAALNYQYYPQGKLFGSYAGDAKDFTSNDTAYYYFGEPGALSDYTYKRDAVVEKIKITWRGTPEVSVDVYVKLVDVRPVTTINPSVVGTVTADTVGEVTLEKVQAAVTGSVTFTDPYNTGLTAIDWSKVVFTLGEITLNENGDPAVAASGTVKVTLTLAATADYRSAAPVEIEVPINNPVYNPTIVLDGGNVTLKLYSDAECTTEVTDLTNLAPATYYVKVMGVADGYDINTVKVIDTTATGTDGVYSLVVDAHEAATQTITVNATAELMQYEVYFDGVKADYTVAHGNTIAAPAAPTKEGYEFDYWMLNDVEYDFSAPVTGEIRLTSKWTLKNYTIKWYVDGALFDTTTFEFGADVVAPTVSDKLGYAFAWSGEVPAKMPAQNLEIYGAYTANQFTVTWNADGTKTTATYSVGDTIVLPTAPTKEGHTFKGWTGYTDGMTMPANNVELIADWTVNTYNITWNCNGWVADLYGASVTLPESAEYGSTVTIIISGPTKDGHTFDGFTSGEVVVSGEPNSDRMQYSFVMPAEDVTITANFEIKTYTIKFIDENDNLIGEAQTVNHGAMPVIPVAPEKADTVEWDYTFAGWDSDVAAATGDKIYKATYSSAKQKYTITWVVAGNTYTTSVDYGTVPTAPAYTLPENHKFVAWDVEPVAVTGTASYTAVLTLEATNGSIYINKNYTSSGNALALADLRKNVLTAAGLDYTLDYVVITSLSVDTKLPLVGVVNINLQINADNTITMINPGINETAFNAAIAAINALSSVEQVFSSALDNDSSREFTITSHAGVSANVTMQITDTRTAATLNHNGTKYTAANLGNLSLDAIKGHMISNATVSSVVWETPDQVLVPGQDNTVYVIVTLVATSTVYVENEGKYRVAITVTVPYTQATIEVPSTGEITYNTSMTDFDKALNIWNALNPQFTPAGGTYTYEVFYLANKARMVDLTINLNQMDLGTWGALIKRILGDSITVQIPVEDMWVNIGEDLTLPAAPSNERIEEILVNDLLPTYGTKFINGELSAENMKDILVETLTKYPDIAEYYEYLGAHYFGENDDKNADGNVLETVYVKVYNYTIDGTNNLGDLGSETTTQAVIALGDTRIETEIKVNTGVTVVYGQYTEAQLLALILDGVYANGTRIDGLDVEFVTNVIGLPAAEASEIVIKFAGNKDYKPSTATATIVINKAPVSVNIDSQVVKYGNAYNMPVITNPADVDTIQFIVGLDISGFNVDPSAGANVSAIKGVLGSVQLLLPEDLQDMLVIADDTLGLGGKLKDGASLKLSELKQYVELLNGKIPGYEEYFAVLFKMLDSLPTETADVEVKLGGSLPTNIGAYLIGAVTADPNYETAFGAGVLVIYPDGIRAEIAWNQNDENHIITNSLLASGAFDTSAHATSVGAGGTIEEATAQIVEIFLGVDIDAQIILESDPSKLDVGAYVEIAIVANWGNQMYYSEPIARPIMVVAETLDVDFVDEDGAINNERHFEFFNVPQNGMEGNLLVTYKQGGNGYKAGDVVTLPYTVKYLYAGVQTNGQPYASEVAPTHAGVYAITAIVVVRNADGTISHAGQGIGALVIEPSKSETTVDNDAIMVDGNKHMISHMIHASSVNVPGLIPDTTIISAGLSANLDNVSGLNAINGTVNIDLPAWMDRVMDELNVLEAGYVDGISAEVFLNYVNQIRAGMVELGVETESFDKIVSMLEQMPINTNLTFYDDIAYSEVGAYLVIAVVTDSNHYPSFGAGILVIYPDATKVELKFEEDWNNNNIFTWHALENMNLEASAYLNGAYCEEADKKVVNLYFGFTDDGEFMLDAVVYGETIKDVPEFRNGGYAQLALVQDLGNKMYYAEPISRTFVIVPTPAVIEFVDEAGNVNGERHFVFDGKAHGMNVRVTIAGVEKTDLSNLTITYVGLQTNGVKYNSEAAPTHAGVYAVTATMTDRDELGRLVTLGVAVGAMVIEPAKVEEIDVANKTHQYDNTGVSTGSMVTVDSGIVGINPDKTVITVGINTDGTFSENLLDAIKGEINVDLPAWADEILSKIDGVEDGVTVKDMIAAIEKVETRLEALAAEVGVTVDVKAFDALVKILAQMPENLTVTFQDDLAVSSVGAYLVIGVVTDSDFYPAMDAGVLVIYPEANKAELNWIYPDSNNIFTLDTLAVVDLGAYATVNGIVSDAVPFNEIFLGVNAETMEVTLTRDQNDLDVGIYTEFAFVLDIDSQMYVATPIAREVIIVPNVYDIVVDGATYTYDGTAKPIVPSAVLNQFNKDILANGELYVTYAGITGGLDAYLGKTAPVNAGAYTVVLTFVTYDAEGNITGAGSEIVTLVIKKQDPVFDLTDKDVTFNGEGHFVGVVNNHGVDYVAVIRTEDGVNLILTEGLNGLADFLGDDVYDLTGLKAKIQSAIDTVENLNLDSEFVSELLKAVEEVNDSAVYKISINGANPVKAGSYKAYAITVPTTNYGVDVAKGTLVIKPIELIIAADNKTKVEGETDPELTYVVTAGGEKADVDGLDVTITRAPGEVVGTYIITVSAQCSNSNYEIVEIINAVFTITAEEIVYNVKNYTGNADIDTWKIDSNAKVISVFNDLACVVVIEHADGTYTRLAAVANGMGGYDFDITAMKNGEYIIIAVKGDINLNGSIEGLEAVQIKNTQLGNITGFTKLQTIVSDLDGDGVIEALEAVQIKNAQLGKLELGW